MSLQRDYWDSLAPSGIDASTIDPNDVIGEKNRYLGEIRNSEIVKRLDQRVSRSGVVLDLGCGNGSLSSSISAHRWAVIGLDISGGLLRRTSERHFAFPALFAQYNGCLFPVADSSVDAITTYVVLNHVIDDRNLASVLSECARVLKDSGVMVCIEQITRTQRLSRKYWKLQRTKEDFIQHFNDANLRVRSIEVVRYGHFLTTPIIRLGWIPRRMFRFIAACERFVGRIWRVAWFDYADAVFVIEKAPPA